MKQQIIKNNLITCLLAAVLTAAICVVTYAYSFEKTMHTQAKAQCELLKVICENSQSIPDTLKKLKKDFQARITFISSEGQVAFDSAYDENILENHMERTEIIAALNKGVGSAKRYSVTDKRNNYYYAIKIDNAGVVRVGVHSNQFMTEAITPNLPAIGGAILFVLVFVFFASSHTTKKIISTIENFDFESDNALIYDEIAPFISKINSQNKTIKIQSEKNKAEKDKLESVFSNMREGIIVCDNDKIIVQINLEAQEIFLARVGQHFSSSMRNAELDKNLNLALASNTVHGVMQHLDKSYQYTINPNLQNGKITGAILICLDITQQIQAQKIKREFTTNVTHELKTPLTSILGYSQLVSNQIAKQEDIVKFSKIIEKNAQQLLILIDDIIKLSALEENEQSEKQKVIIKEVVEEILNDLSPLIIQKEICLKTNIQDLVITASLKNIEDLCKNLISNAIKYNKQGGSISLDLFKQNEKIIIKVADTGIGIPKEDINKVFERFYVVDKSRNKNISSTGLGLSIVKHIVNLMGGTVVLNSALNEGSEFTITLPQS